MRPAERLCDSCDYGRLDRCPYFPRPVEINAIGKRGYCRFGQKDGMTGEVSRTHGFRSWPQVVREIKK